MLNTLLIENDELKRELKQYQRKLEESKKKFGEKDHLQKELDHLVTKFQDLNRTLEEENKKRKELDVSGISGHNQWLINEIKKLHSEITTLYDENRSLKVKYQRSKILCAIRLEKINKLTAESE